MRTSLTIFVLLTIGCGQDLFAQGPCLTYKPERQYLECVNTQGCSSSAWITTCGGSFGNWMNKCSCFPMVVNCCGTQLDSYLTDPCAYDCAGGCVPGPTRGAGGTATTDVHSLRISRASAKPPTIDTRLGSRHAGGGR